MVRHEAAEALGAIAAPECLDLLRQVGGLSTRSRVSAHAYMYPAL